MSSYLVRPHSAAGFAGVFFVAFSFLLTGCQGTGSTDTTPEAQEQATEAATLLSGVDETAFRRAFQSMGDFEYTRYTRTEQFDTEDYLVAYREFISRSTETAGVRSISIQSSDSAGVFDFGFFDRFTSQNLSGLDPVDLIPFLLPEDPPYLRPRNRDKYEWNTLADTLLWDTQAKVIEVKARPLYGDGENIRRVRHYVDRTTNELIAMYLERVDLALLFREESQFYVHMRRTSDGDMVPHNTRFHTHIKTPFRTDSKFRTVSTYYEVDRVSGSAALSRSPEDSEDGSDSAG